MDTHLCLGHCGIQGFIWGGGGDQGMFQNCMAKKWQITNYTGIALFLITL